MKNIYILRKQSEKAKRRWKVAANILCRCITSCSMLVAFVAVAGDGPLMLGRRATMLAVALILMFIVSKVEDRIYIELPLEQWCIKDEEE